MSETSAALDEAKGSPRGRLGRRGKDGGSGAAKPGDPAGKAASPGRASSVASNRAEITITSFDFLGGAYGLTTRARRVMYGVIGLLGLGVAYLLVSVVSALSAASAADAEVASWQARETEVIASFGEAAGINVDQRLAIERRQALEESLVDIVAGQFDMAAALAEVSSVVVTGASPVTMRLGFLAATVDDPSSLDPAKGAPVEIVGEADGYLQGVEWAAGIASLPGFYDAQGVPAGATSVLVTAFLPLGVPPAALVQRLSDQGIVYVAPEDPQQLTAPTSAKKDSDAAEGGK